MLAALIYQGLVAIKAGIHKLLYDYFHKWLDAIFYIGYRAITYETDSKISIFIAPDKWN